MDIKRLLCFLLLIIAVIPAFATLPKIACVGMSALLPGSGEIILGQKTKGSIMTGVDVLAISSWLATGRQVDDLTRSYQRFATVYAGCPEDMNNTYYQHLQQYLSSDEFNQFQDMMARNYYLIYTYDPDGYNAYILANTYQDTEAWNWQSAEHQDHYRSLRRRAQTAKMYKNLSLGVLLLNRAISMIDTALIKSDPNSGTALYFSPLEDNGLMLNYRMEF